MKKVTMTLMAAFFTITIATTAFAFGWGRGPGYGPCGRGDFRGPAGLNLTQEQQAKFKELQEKKWKEIKPLQEQTFSKRDALRKLWLEPNPDQAKIMAAQKEIRALRDQMQDKTTAFRLEMIKLLTPEQREKIKYFGKRGPNKKHGRRVGPRSWGGVACFGCGPGGLR